MGPRRQQGCNTKCTLHRLLILPKNDKHPVIVSVAVSECSIYFIRARKIYLRSSSQIYFSSMKLVISKDVMLLV